MTTRRQEGIRRTTLFAAGLIGVSGAFAEPKGLGKDPIGSRQATLQDEAARAVRARLIGETDRLTPGGRSWLALTFDIEPGWHLYWHNAGDSGMPISFRFDTPAGISIGEAHWPTPERHVSAGIILDYVYEHRATILIPVDVDARVTGPVAISASVQWLVCREACVPGGTTVAATFQTGPAGARGADAARFEEARKRIPVVHDPADRGKIEARFSGHTLEISAPRADGLVFYPFASERAVPLNAIEQGESNTDRLSIEFTEGVTEEPTVKGVVEVRREGQAPEFWLVSIDPRAGS